MRKRSASSGLRAIQLLHSRRRSALPLLAASALSACVTPAINLQPESVPPDHGATMGHIQVFKGDDEVTGSCYVQFTDGQSELKAGLSLDDSGWVFAALRAGPTYLSDINCVVWNGLQYGSRQLRFDVAPGKTTYFGHLAFRLADRDAEITGQAIASSAAGVPVASVAGALVATAVVATGEIIRIDSPDGKDHVTVENRLEPASHEYSARYHRPADACASLAGASPPAPAR